MYDYNTKVVAILWQLHEFDINIKFSLISKQHLMQGKGSKDMKLFS